MNSAPEWLPPLALLQQYGGEWERYLDAIYKFFQIDFVSTQPAFCDQPVRLKRHPLLQDKEATFWHLISEGADESQRLPDLRRCERIRWPRPMIESSPSGHVRCWETVRRNEKRFLIALDDFSYVVVLAIRAQHVLLWTAYCVEHDHRRRKLQKEWQRSKIS